MKCPEISFQHLKFYNIAQCFISNSIDFTGYRVINKQKINEKRIYLQSTLSPLSAWKKVDVWISGYIELFKNDEFEALMHLANTMAHIKISKETGMTFLLEII